MPETENLTLTEQMKKRLHKLQAEQRMTEENMATILSMRERDHNYLNADTEWVSVCLSVLNAINAEIIMCVGDFLTWFPESWSKNINSGFFIFE